MKHKYVCSILLVLVLLCTCLTGAVTEEEEREIFTSGDYEYALLDDGTVEITKYTGSAEEIAVPDTIDGKTVTQIGDFSFLHCTSLTSVTLPDSIREIGHNAFAACLITSINIPDSVTEISDGAFIGCVKLSDIVLPDSITKIGDYAFGECIFLTTFHIPASLTEISNNPFFECVFLREFTISPDHPYFEVIDGVLFRKENKCLVAYPQGKFISTYAIPDGTLEIGVQAFSSTYSVLTSITIPDSVTTIDYLAFNLCYSLVSLSIPDSVTSIGENAFYGCPDLTLSVPRDSCAAKYAQANSIPYAYADN